ncbi:hypothetical protein GH714_006646 [Hevea brasiliensis]|uniref:Calcineurin B-like protein n=1 Tax=Hevea brasiliensis TaxID=3981 RepID=A0A6A6LD65_HEVBR|nr:hypothetical protein GH714_006646 [Hevea brasiliensis]
MGCLCTKLRIKHQDPVRIKHQDLAVLASQTNFNEAQVEALFAFQLYDMRQTGFIERSEVKKLILALLQESDLILPDDIVESIIDKTFKDADTGGDGKIDVREWEEFVIRNPTVLKTMTIPYLKDLTTEFPSFVLISEIEDDLNK